jgi:hypothetical protein
MCGYLIIIVFVTSLLFIDVAFLGGGILTGNRGTR